MDKDFLDKREKELREQYPDSFSHAELRSGEIYLGYYIAEAAGPQASIYRDHGMPSARVSLTPIMKWYKDIRKITYYALFVNLRELIEAEEKERLKKLASAS